MGRLFKLALLAFALAVGFVVCSQPAHAFVDVFILHDHPTGDLVPPTYGLRIDDLIWGGSYTFSFDYADMTGTASVMLTYDDVAGTVRITGRAYGGQDLGTSWKPDQQGWIDIDFLYSVGVVETDDCPGNPGDDLYAPEAVGNGGTVTLDGWGGDAVYAFEAKANETGCAFIFDNDDDLTGNTTIANDPSIFSGFGWLKPPTPGGFRDWVFIGERVTVGTEATTWGAVKARYR